MRLSRIFIVGAVSVLGGCYTYQVASPEDVALDTEVRVRLSPEGAQKLQDVRMTEDRVMEGKLVERRESMLLVETNVSRFDPAVGGRILNQIVTVESTDLREIEIKTLDRTKTGAAAAALAVIVGVVIAQQLQEGSGSTGGPPTGPPESRVSPIPLLRIPVR